MSESWMSRVDTILRERIEVTDEEQTIIETLLPRGAGTMSAARAVMDGDYVIASRPTI